MFSSLIHVSLRSFITSNILVCALVASTHALLGPAQSLGSATLIDNVTRIAQNVSKSVLQQNLAMDPPFPILRVGLEHMMAEIEANKTQDTVAETQGQSSNIHSLFTSVTPAQCGPGLPCSDGSCCNSAGQCGFTSSTCKNSSTTTCISNCDAIAMCGALSLDGAVKCPLNLCCSYVGYCGSSELYCVNMDPTGLTMPCQQGYGDCQVVPDPSCSASNKSTTNGRKMAYWQSGNVQNRACNRIEPSQIDTRGLTHLNFAFASIDPIHFNVTPSDPLDSALYSEFTALKSNSLQTWISFGGFNGNDPGQPYTTWSNMCSTPENRAAFISSAIEFMDKWGFQGVDIDWEYPAVLGSGGRPEDTENLVALVKEMRAAFGTKYGVSVVLPPDFFYLKGMDPIGMQCYVDFFNFMAYDLHGPWEAWDQGAFVRPQTSVLDIDTAMRPLWFDGVDPSKINMGIAYYARGYTLSNTSCTDIGCPYSDVSKAANCTGSPGVMGLREITRLIKEKSLTPKLYPDAMVKQIVWDNDQWIGYDDDETIGMKMNWADEHCFGGISIWSIDFNSGRGSGDSLIMTTTDGLCGHSKTCAGASFGECCSEYGHCGDNSAYCSVNNGCQSSFGFCQYEDVSISGDGSCGNRKTCLGSQFGNCCSGHGYCGSSDAYCLPSNGCQIEWGTCS